MALRMFYKPIRSHSSADGQSPVERRETQLRESGETENYLENAGRFTPLLEFFHSHPMESLDIS